MIFFVNAEGTLQQVITQPVYQGSSLASEIVLIAPYRGAGATCAFTLPNGVTTTERVMTPVSATELQGQLKDANEKDLYVWRFLVDRSITAYAGTLQVQFFIYAGTNNIIASFTSSLNIQKGVNVVLPTEPTTDVYQEILGQLSLLQLQLDSGSFTVNNLYIRYSFSPMGEEMTTEWQEGQTYLGTYVGRVASTDYNDYNWVQFVGGTFCYENAESGIVTVNMTDQSDLTLTSENLQLLTINLPDTIAHGFYAGLNFKTTNFATVVQFQNPNVNLPLKIIKRAVEITSFAPATNSNIQMLFYCDGLNVYCYILEF